MDTRRNYLLRKHKLSVMTGMSVMVAGVKLEIVRDPARKVAWIEGWGTNLLGSVGEAAISSAADILLLRAQRFLGPNWKVLGLPEHSQPTLPSVVMP